MKFIKVLKRQGRILAEEGEVTPGQEGQQETEGKEEDTTQEQGDQDQAPARGATAFYKEQAAKLKRQIEEMQGQMGQYKSQIEMKEEERLREQNKWQELAEKYKNERDKAHNDYNQFKGSMVEYQKLNAVRQAALKAGIVEASLDDLELMNLDDVEIETTSSGRLMVHGQDDFVEKLKEMRPHWFKANRPPNINNGVSNDFEPKKLSMSEIVKLQKENPAEYKKQMQKILEKRNAGRV